MPSAPTTRLGRTVGSAVGLIVVALLVMVSVSIRSGPAGGPTRMMMPGKWRLVVNGRVPPEVPIPTGGRTAAPAGRPPPCAKRMAGSEMPSGSAGSRQRLQPASEGEGVAEIGGRGVVLA